MNPFKLVFPTTTTFRSPAAARNPRDAQTRIHITIEHGHCVRVPVEAGDHVACIDGCVWITRDGDIKDVVLSAGEHWTADHVARFMFTAPGSEASTLWVEAGRCVPAIALE